MRLHSNKLNPLAFLMMMMMMMMNGYGVDGHDDFHDGEDPSGGIPAHSLCSKKLELSTRHRFCVPRINDMVQADDIQRGVETKKTQKSLIL